MNDQKIAPVRVNSTKPMNLFVASTLPAFIFLTMIMTSKIMLMQTKCRYVIC